MNNKDKYRKLFLIDDTRDFTNNYYIFALIKIVLFQEGAFSLSLNDICEKIEEITDMQYTLNDLLHSIDTMNNNIIECLNDEYSLTTHGESLMKQRQKATSIEPYVKKYCNSYECDNKPNEEYSIDLIYRFIFEKFNENLSQIACILNNNIDLDLPKERYSDSDNQFINGFLKWENEEKNKLIFDLISKAFDYCMINSKCNQSSLDWTKFNFYIDTNIIFRLMGLNNDTRKNSVKSFIDKCTSTGVHIRVSNFVLDECEATIDHQIEMLINRTTPLASLISPTSMNFAEESSFGCDFYKIYYNWCRSGNKHRNYEGFRRHIKKEYKNIISDFDKDNNNISYKITEEKLFNQLYNSLFEIKVDKHTVNTDVNSILHIKSLREKDENTEVFFISSDKVLISWLNDIYKSEKGLVDYPSTWLSIMLKYTGREKADDYRSFCQFIHLPIVPEPKDDLKKKIEIKSSIMASDFDDGIKDQMIQEIRQNYATYRETNIDEVLHRAYAKTEEKIKNEAKEEYQSEIEEKINTEKTKEDSLHQKEIKEIKDNSKQQLKDAKNTAYSKGKSIGEDNVLQSIAKKSVKRKNILKKIGGVLLIVAIIVFILTLVLGFITRRQNAESDIWMKISNINNLLSIISIIYGIGYSAINLIFGPKLFITDEDEMFRKLKTKYESKNK